MFAVKIFVLKIDKVPRQTEKHEVALSRWQNLIDTWHTTFKISQLADLAWFHCNSLTNKLFKNNSDSF